MKHVSVKPSLNRKLSGSRRLHNSSHRARHRNDTPLAQRLDTMITIAPYPKVCTVRIKQDVSTQPHRVPSNDQNSQSNSLPSGSKTQADGFDAAFSAQCDLRDCPHPLRQAFQICSEDEFPLLACAISCVNSSQEQLSVRAMCEAVTLFIDYPSQGLVLDTDVVVFNRWLRRFQPLFAINEFGGIAFTNPSMRLFLKRYALHGVDASQKTIAMLCLAQVGLKQDCDNLPFVDEVHGQSFSTYATKNWRYHQHIAMKSSLSLKLTGFRFSSTRSCRPSLKAANCQSFLREKEHLNLSDTESNISSTLEELREGWQLVEIPDNAVE